MRISQLTLSAWLILSAIASARGQFTFALVGGTNIGPTTAVVLGNNAYLLNDGFPGLRIMDVTTPANITDVGRLTNASGGYDMALSGNDAYVAANNSLWIADISDPANPFLTRSTNVAFGYTGIAVCSNRLCLFGNYAGAQVYDISNPTNPISAGLTNTGPYGYDGALSGNYFYFAGSFHDSTNNQYYGLLIFDVSGTNPVSVAHAAKGWNVNCIALSSNYAYMEMSSNAVNVFAVYDVSNPANPLPVFQTNSLLSKKIRVAGNYAYLLAGGLRVYDISNPANPVFAGQVVVGPAVNADLTVAGNCTYLSDNGFWIYLLVPQAAISLTDSNTALVSWSVPPATNFILQQSYDLGAADWTDITNIPGVVSNRNQILLSPSSGYAFYRLRSQ